MVKAVDKTKQRKERRTNVADLSDANKLLDRLIRNHALLLSANEGEIRRARSRLVRMADQLEAKLASAVAAETLTKAEQTKLLSELLEIRQRGNEQYAKTVDRQARKLTQGKLKEDTKAIDTLIGVSFDEGISPDQLALIAKRDVLGEKAARWFKDQGTASHGQLSRSIRLAFAEGASIQRIVSLLRDQSKKDKRELETLARTMVSGIANEAAHNLYDRNKDVLRGKQWISTLDDATTLCCGPLDKRIWLYEGTPNVSTMPRAPRHPNCRCFVVPAVRGFKFDAPGWGEFIERQDKQVQIDILGPTRARLLRANLVTPRQLQAANGRVRTVAELMNMLRAEGVAA